MARDRSRSREREERHRKHRSGDKDHNHRRSDERDRDRDYRKERDERRDRDGSHRRDRTSRDDRERERGSSRGHTTERERDRDGRASDRSRGRSSDRGRERVKDRDDDRRRHHQDAEEGNHSRSRGHDNQENLDKEVIGRDEVNGAVNERDTDGAGAAEEPQTVDLNAVTPEEMQMMLAMGIPFGFDTTQGKSVDDDAAKLGAVKTKTTRRARQYMNRRGGFNRPLNVERTGEKQVRN